MPILSNTDLLPLLDGSMGPPLVLGLGNNLKLGSPNGPIESCSIRLTVGEIFRNQYVEDARFGIRANHAIPKESIQLPPGGVAFVTTEETINFDGNHAGIMTAKSGGVAERGILITNTGQVDAGYKGKLRYAVMNMGSEPFGLSKGQSITKLMVFRLQSPADPTWSGYAAHQPPASPNSANLASLGEELLSLEYKAKKIAREEAWDMVQKFGLPATLTAVVASVVVSAATSAFAIIQLASSSP